MSDNHDVGGDDLHSQQRARMLLDAILNLIELSGDLGLSEELLKSRKFRKIFGIDNASKIYPVFNVNPQHIKILMELLGGVKTATNLRRIRYKL